MSSELVDVTPEGSETKIYEVETLESPPEGVSPKDSIEQAERLRASAIEKLTRLGLTQEEIEVILR